MRIQERITETSAFRWMLVLSSGALESGGSGLGVRVLLKVFERLFSGQARCQHEPWFEECAVIPGEDEAFVIEFFSRSREALFFDRLVLHERLK